MDANEAPPIKFAEKVNELLVGKLDFNELARQATRIILQELRLTAVTLFRIDHREKVLKPYAYATTASPGLINSVIQQPLTSFKVPLGRIYDNLTENTLNTGQINTSLSLGDFGKRDLTPKLQKILGTRFHISVSIKTKNQVEGVLVCATRQKYLPRDRISLLETAAAQLGLALGNVIAHEQIIEQYKASSSRKEKTVEKTPKIKFTLRIPRDLEHYLSYKVANTKQSKAEYVRKLIADLKRQDGDYQKFIEP